MFITDSVAMEGEMDGTRMLWLDRFEVIIEPVPPTTTLAAAAPFMGLCTVKQSRKENI